MNVDPRDTFEETSKMKQNAPNSQGTDAALEQLIKRSKFGAKIKVLLLLKFLYFLLSFVTFQHMDTRGWNQEFRTMPGNILIQKKLERDAGRKHHKGAHLRTNFKEVVAVEHLFEAEGWLKNPRDKKMTFENLDKTSILDESLTQVWALCGQNRDDGVASILGNKKVMFKNVRTNENDVEETQKDLKTLKKELLEMISAIPAGDKMRGYFESVYKKEVSKSSSLATVEEFYWLVRDNNESVSDSSSDESLFDE